MAIRRASERLRGRALSKGEKAADKTARASSANRTARRRIAAEGAMRASKRMTTPS